ncbi:unnamed protein product [Periconia digitata]|uniref:Uncharacterized protein n=1 Tax=Periconia digitata TaxID=1303443 RepID=A0A9W4UI37_9PLEO|nr:unnamed protein product [Periconia digitata]
MLVLGWVAQLMRGTVRDSKQRIHRTATGSSNPQTTLHHAKSHKTSYYSKHPQAPSPDIPEFPRHITSPHGLLGPPIRPPDGLCQLSVHDQNADAYSNVCLHTLPTKPPYSITFAKFPMQPSSSLYLYCDWISRVTLTFQ